MAENEWKTRLKKWEDGIKLSIATKADVLEYMDTKLHEYTQDRITDDNLWYGFKEDFKDFTLDTFANIGWKHTQRLRTYLRCGGVRVEQNSPHLTIAGGVYNVLLEDVPQAWDANDLSQAAGDLQKGPITSFFITADAKNLRQEQPPGAGANTGAGTGSGYGGQSPPGPPSGPPGGDGPSGGPGGRPGRDFSGGPEQTFPPPTQPQTISIGKLIGEVARILTDEQKYAGTNGSFSQKQVIFHDICHRVGVPKGEIMKAFPTMLKGLAQDHFYNHRLSERTYDEACANIRGFFEGPSAQRSALDKWNNINLPDLMTKNTENKPTYEVVQSMINALRELQYGLASTLQNDDFLHNKIITACQGVPACRIAVSDPPPGIGPLVNKLQSSITSYEKEQESSEAFFTDRRYHRSTSDGRLRSRPSFNTNRTSRNSKGCFICKKPNCHSWKHTLEEQEEHKAKFRANNTGTIRTYDPGGMRFLAKEREYLTIDKSIKYNGGIIQLQGDGSITLTQERQCGNLKSVSNEQGRARSGGMGGTRGNG
jgi:hypothetical protein